MIGSLSNSKIFVHIYSVILIFGFGIYIFGMAPPPAKKVAAAAAVTPTAVQTAAPEPIEIRRRLVMAVIAECLYNKKLLMQAIEINSRGYGIFEDEYREMYNKDIPDRLVEKTIYKESCNARIKRLALIKFVKNEKLFVFSLENRKKWDDIVWTLKNQGILSGNEAVKDTPFKDCVGSKKLFEAVLEMFGGAKTNGYDFKAKKEE